MVRIRTREKTADLRVRLRPERAVHRVRSAGIRTAEGTPHRAENGEESPSAYAQDKVRYVSASLVQSGRRTAGKAAGYAVSNLRYRRRRKPGPRTGPGGEKKKEPWETEKNRVEEQGEEHPPKAETRERDARTGRSGLQDASHGDPPETRSRAEHRRAERAASDAGRKAGREKSLRNAAEKAVQAVRSAVEKAAPERGALLAGLAAAGMLVLLLCLSGVFSRSALGILLTEAAGSGEELRTAMREISEAFQDEIDAVRASSGAETCPVTGTQAPWTEILSVYAVKTANDPDDPQEVLRMTEKKERQLRQIFRDMNVLTAETVGTEETGETQYMEIRARTAEEMAVFYGFTRLQREQLQILLSAEGSLWLPVLYGAAPDSKMVSVALSQLGNTGGQPYWSWYGYPSRVDWCACFVSWCADRCGYLEDGTLPKFAWCPYGAEWFRERGLWAENSVTPEPGMIVFFDWDGGGTAGPQDGIADHTGIVERVENGMVWTVEGNREDSCREKQYPVGHYEILGYGMRGSPGAG